MERRRRTSLGPAGKAEPDANPNSGASFSIVGIGASAGGYEAASELLKNLPLDTGMAFAVVQHLDPVHESRLTELLSRSTSMTVVQVENRAAVLPNNVYVIPPNRELAVSEGKFHLRPRTKRAGNYMPVDVLFRSLAAEQGNRAIGVILSGNGSDGTLGLQAIKGEGGITFAQDIRTAKFHSMPASAIAAGCVDMILPPAGIAAELARLARHPSLRPAKLIPAKVADAEKPEEDYRKVYALLRGTTGVDFTHYKPTTLKRRLLRRMVLRKVESLSQYIEYLHDNAAEVDALFEDILINVTEFFRDPSVFHALKRRVLPRIMKHKAADGSFRVWVPGCSTGEEAYSLAICIHEFLAKQLNSMNLQVFATDIGESTLAKARLGIYPASAVTGLGAERLHRYFQQTDGGCQIAKFIRDMCVFARQNVAEDPPFSKLDLISCRNVLIYLGPVLQKKIMPIFHYALNPHGFLLLGASETIGTHSDLFTLADKRNKIYSRRQTATRPEPSFLPRTIPESSEGTKAARATTESPGPDLRRQVEQLLLSHYLPAGVVLNSEFEVLQFRGQTGPYLEHSPGDASLKLLKMVREGLVVDLRTALSRAAKSEEPIRKPGIRFQSNDRLREVTLEVVPVCVPPSRDRYYLVLFLEPTIVSEETKRRTKSDKPNRHAEREVQQLKDDLRATNESLQAIIEEQEATNEELKSANEEIQSSNEELQSTNEELETAKEELQSTNEELTTLNEELQNRNNDLAQVNNDLSNLISSFNLPILILGNDLSVRRFTPMAEKIFNLIPSDVGRPVSDINPQIIFPDLPAVVREVIETLHTREFEVQDRDGRWHSLRIRPYRTTENKIEGAVLVLIDIDEMKQGLTEFISLIRHPVLMLTGDLRVLEANPAFYETFNTARDETEHRPIFEMANGQWNTAPLRALLEGTLPERPHVENFRLEQDFPNLGRRTMLCHAHRLQQSSKGTQLIMVVLEDVTKPK
jgi:two-component system CheB/CheR fusion protein